MWFQRLYRALPEGSALRSKIPTLTFGFAISLVVPMLALRWLRVRLDDALVSGAHGACRRSERSDHRKHDEQRWSRRWPTLRHASLPGYPSRNSPGASMHPSAISTDSAAIQCPLLV